MPPGAGVTLDVLLVDDSEGDPDGEGEGDAEALASFSRIFLIFRIALTGGGAKCCALEHPKRRMTAIINVILCKKLAEFKDFTCRAYEAEINGINNQVSRNCARTLSPGLSESLVTSW
jgi:hypothetical protein